MSEALPPHKKRGCLIVREMDEARAGASATMRAYPGCCAPLEVTSRVESIDAVKLGALWNARGADIEAARVAVIGQL